MAYPHFRPAAVQTAGHIHQTTEIPRQQSISAGGQDIINLGIDHMAGYIGILDAKQAAKSATGFTLLAFLETQSADPAQ